MSAQKEIKRLGIWMDHFHAHLIEYNDITKNKDTITQKTIHHRSGNNDNDQNESMVHNKENQDQSEFYKNIKTKILEYNDILLFGPTDAKTELINILRADHHFDLIKIESRSADKMTENQEYAFVKDYFFAQESDLK